MHIAASIVLFVVSLGLPAFYVRSYEAKPGIGLLLGGWTGVLVGIPTWLANPAYFVALALSRRDTAAPHRWALAAIVLSLTFLAYRKLPLNASGVEIPVEAYGPGYVCWIAAFVVLAFGLSRRHWRKARTKPMPPYLSGTAEAFILAASAAAFAVHHFSPGGAWSITSARRHDFDKLCSTVTEHRGEPAYNVRSVFLDPDWAPAFGRIIDGRYFESGGGMYFPAAKLPGSLEFYETWERSDRQGKFRRVYADSRQDLVDEISSDYSILAEPLDPNLHPDAGVTGARIVIRDRRDGRIVGVTSFATERSTRRVCVPNGSASWSARGFAREMLIFGPKPP